MSGWRWRLIKEQIVVQLLVRTLNFFSLSLFTLQPAIFAAVGMLLSHAAGNAMPDLVYSVIGGGIMGMWSGIVFTSTFDITGDRRNGMLELIVGSPTSLAAVEAIRTLTNVIAGLVSLGIAFTAAVVVFGYNLTQVNVWGVLVSLLLLLFSMWVIGIFLANFLAASRINGSFTEYLEMPIAILCGFMFPLRVLPDWMQFIATAVPIRWALEAMNESLLGNRDIRFLAIHWGIALGLSLAALFVTRWLQNKVHDRIRISGELSSI